jgi:hypothetical protein
MDRQTILTPVACELRRLPLDAIDAFVLSQVDGRLTLEEIGEIVGLDFVKTTQVASRLVELGAVRRLTPSDEPDRRNECPPRSGMNSPKRSVQAARPDPRAESRSVRLDPRSEEPSVRPRAVRTEKDRAPLDTGAEQRSVRPEPRKETAKERPEARKERRRSTASMAARTAAVRGAPHAAEVECDLDEATYTRIIRLDAKLRTLDHYALLEIERGADKRDVKRAFFAMAASFHPDRFFGKKLGAARGPLDRIFIRVTEAHDTLASRARRSEYDATLPAPPPRPPTKSVSKPVLPKTQNPSRRLSSKAVKSSTRRSTASSMARPVLVDAAPAERAPVVDEPAQPASTPGSADPNDRFRRLQATAKLMEAQRRAEVFQKAAEESLQADDVIGAANNYRLALECAEDPFVRRKYEAVDDLARARRHEKSLLRARAAERNEAWADAATHFVKAHEARPEASTAERAAHALRMSGGDLRAAATLAEQAVALDSKNATYHVTLGAIYLAAKLVDRATTEADLALTLAPDDPHAQRLAAALRKQK